MRAPRVQRLALRRAGRRAPSRLLAASALLLALAAAAGCTGTFTPGTPLALLVVNGPAGAPSEVLVYAVDPPGPAAPRDIRPLGLGTVTPEVDGPVVALDWLDREETGTAPPAGRRILGLLVSERTAAPLARSARLFAYDTTAFDIAAPAPLTPYTPLTLPLVVGGMLQVPAAPGVQAPDPGVCLSALSLSRTGRYLALLDARRACDPAAATTENFLLLVDLQTQQLVLSTVAAPVRGVPPLIDQEANRVEYVTETVGTVVRRVSLVDRTAVLDTQPLPGVTSLDQVLAFGRYGADRLVVVGQALFRVDAGGAALQAVTTAPNVTGLVETGAGLPVVLRTATGLAVHTTPADDDEAFLAGAYVDGVTDLPDLMAYLLRPGAIDSLDLLLYDPTDLNPIATARTTYAAPAIQAPRAITFFRPRPTTLP